MEAKQTPLIELLEQVPQDARVVVEHDQFSSSSHPVGRLCHEAAAALRAALQQEAKDWKCFCDENGLGVPGVTCGDCPRDYKTAAEIGRNIK